MKKEFKTRFNELQKTKATTTAKIGRGQDFEKLINDMFEDENILLHRSYHTYDNKAEQIDGAIELLNRIILFEVKWVESNLAASDLYAFIGKIENKLIGTLGLFISREELSDNFIAAITKGRKRNVLLLHGNDIDLLFAGHFSPKDYLEHCIRRYSFDNILHYAASSYIESKKLDKLSMTASVPPSNKSEGIKAILRLLFQDDRVEEYVIDLEIEKLRQEERKQLAIYLLGKYPKYYDAYTSSLFSKRNRNQLSNMKYALSEVLKQKEVTESISDNFFDLYCSSANERYLEDFLWDAFSYAYEKLKDKDCFIDTLYNNFKKIEGNYDKENLLTRIIREIWDSLDEGLQHKFIYEYIDIFFSSRNDGYEQKEFARALIKRKEYVTVFKKWIESKIKMEIISAPLTVEDIPNEIKYFTRHYSEMMLPLDIDEDAWSEYITKLYKRNLKKR